MYTILTAVFGFSLAICTYAATNHTVHPKIELLRIKAIQTTEKNGDELYFGITVYGTKKKPYRYQIPKYPMYWASQKLNNLSKVSLWQGVLDDGESVNLVISLMEQDTPPWNTDDLIGVISVHMKNQQGKITYSWRMPNRVDPVVTVTSKYGPAQKFELLGDSSRYELYFLQTKDSDPKKSHEMKQLKEKDPELKTSNKPKQSKK